MKNKAFVKGAVVLILCNLIGKVVGAVYRLPLARIVGSVGMGQYQLTFPLYCLILTISTSGMPVAISKLVAEYNSKNRFQDSRRLLKTSILFLSLISLIGSVLILLCAKPIATLQGNPGAYICYYGISPAILFVGLLSAYRGYFQGCLLMFPTAISGLIEQMVKLVAGLYFAGKLIAYGVEYAVFGALIGVSLSELVAVLFLAFSYLIYSKKHRVVKDGEIYNFKTHSKRLMALSVPVTFSSLIAPITSMVDSFLVVNLLMFVGFSSDKATTLLGLQSGVVEPLVNIPVIISVSISAAILPNVSSLVAKHNSSSSAEVKSLIQKAYQICLSISVACFVCFIIFGKQALNFLYGKSFDVGELSTSTKLLFFGAVNIVFLSLVQVTTGILQGIGEHKYTVKSLLAGSGVKIGLDIALLLVRVINIYGAVISAGACYLVVLSLNYKKVKKITGANIKESVFYVVIQAALVCLCAYFANLLFVPIFGDVVSMFIAGILAVSVFAVTYYVFFISKENDSEKALKNKLT